MIINSSNDMRFVHNYDNTSNCNDSLRRAELLAPRWILPPMDSVETQESLNPEP